MSCGAEIATDDEAASRIFEAGWRQGAVIRASDVPGLPTGQVGPDDWLVVCTQSCSVVNPRFRVDTVVEWIVGTPVTAIVPEKARGKNARLFHLPVTGLPGAVAIECNVNRRFFQDRLVLKDLVPAAGVALADGAARLFAGWLSRYYSRVALPNELDRRAKLKKGFFPKIKSLLDNSAPSGQKTFREAVHSIYVKWTPDEELVDDKAYCITLFFLCYDERDADELDERLKGSLADFFKGEHGLVVNAVTAKPIDQIFVADLDSYHRLSEWDYLSDLGDVAEIDARQG